MAKSLRDQLGRRMRAADGSRQLVFGGPEAEKQFAEAQALQQQMTSGNALQNLTAAQNNAATIAQQNIAAQIQDRQFQDQLAQDRMLAEDRSELDRQRQQAQQAEAIGNLRIRGGQLDLDQQRLRNQATQYANQLRVQERQMDQKDAESGLRQKTEISRMADSLLTQASALSLSEEGQAELSKLKSAYRAIQRNRDAMRPAQYNELMQDWMGKLEEANLAQYEQRLAPLAERAGGNVEVINKGGVTLLATQDADGNISYRELRADEATGTAPMQATKQAYAQRMIDDPKFQQQIEDRALQLYEADYPSADGIARTAIPANRYPEYIDRVLSETVDRRNAIMGIANPFADERADFVGPRLNTDSSVQYVPSDGSVSEFDLSEEDNIASASDMQTFPKMSEAQNLPTYGGSKYSYGSGTVKAIAGFGGGSANSPSLFGRLMGDNTPWGNSFKKFWYGDEQQRGLVYGTDSKFKRVLEKGSPEEQLNSVMKTHEKGISVEDVDRVKESVMAEIAEIKESTQAKDLAQRFIDVRGENLDYNRVFNPQMIIKLYRIGVQDPIGNLMMGVVDAIDNDVDHIGTFGTSLEHNTLNAPVIPRDTFTGVAKEDYYDKMPPVWYDEYGIMYQRDQKPDPKPKLPDVPYPPNRVK